MSLEDQQMETEESLEERAKALFDEHAHQIARAAAHHLKIQYPAALKAVPKAAELSLRNSIKAQIRLRFGPLVTAMIALERSWDKPDRR